VTKRNKTIYDLINERFGKGKNRLDDERLSDKGYWESLPQNEEGSPLEPAEANPDLLPESAGAWSAEPSEKQRLQAELIRQAFEKLTEQERAIVEHMASGLSLSRAARKMGMSKDNGYSALKRARAKIQDFLSTRKARFDPYK